MHHYMHLIVRGLVHEHLSCNTYLMSPDVAQKSSPLPFLSPVELLHTQLNPVLAADRLQRIHHWLCPTTV